MREGAARRYSALWSVVCSQWLWPGTPPVVDVQGADNQLAWAAAACWRHLASRIKSRRQWIVFRRSCCRGRLHNRDQARNNDALPNTQVTQLRAASAGLCDGSRRTACLESLGATGVLTAAKLADSRNRHSGRRNEVEKN